jgi:hypothetical protein
MSNLSMGISPGPRDTRVIAGVRAGGHQAVSSATRQEAVRRDLIPPPPFPDRSPARPRVGLLLFPRFLMLGNGL